MPAKLKNPKLPKKKPKPRKAVWLTFKTLATYTPKEVRERSRGSGCKKTFVQWYDLTVPLGFPLPPGSDSRVRIGLRYKTGCSKKIYQTEFVFDNPTKGLDSTGQVRCNCNYHTFYIEFVNSTFGMTTIQKALPQRPEVRNPMFVPHLCKHMYAVLPDAVKRAAQLHRRVEKELDAKTKNKASLSRVVDKLRTHSTKLEKAQRLARKKVPRIVK